ncbi:Putative galectin [Halyomorpha halys]|nr:Putative galectin [Halyomorpha halys]
MERKILILDNQKECPVVAEDALDFNFDDEEKNSPAPGGVPFMHKLGNPFRLKDVLVIEGTILKYGLRFTVNLLYGFNEIAFHLNPRMDQNYIARNSFLNGEWGQEEGFGLMKSPLHSGKNFQIMIFISQEAYLVCVNGFHMFSFAHRVPPQNVEKIEIFGDIDLKAASLMSSNIYPDPNLIKFKKSFETLVKHRQQSMVRKMRFSGMWFSKNFIREDALHSDIGASEGVALGLFSPKL